MQLPEALLNSLEGVNGFDKNSFVELHHSGQQVTSLRINPAKKFELTRAESEIPWTKYGYYLPERPSFTFDPLFHAGCYYVQEASSMFLEQVLKQKVDLTKPLRVLDLCAAPGGKSTHILSLLSPGSLLVTNDVINSRSKILKENIIKWGYSNVIVTNNDPKDFQRLENYFDVILVDAPCSGSGLFRRDPEAIGEWSENNVQLCAQRQQRILADVYPALRKDGLLIYSTCSYSKEEDEDIVQWMKEEMQMESLLLSVEKDWGIIQSGDGYRFYPDKLKGEGFFITCFRKTGGETISSFKIKNKPQKITSREKDVLKNWINMDGLEFQTYNETIHAMSSAIVDDLSIFSSFLRVIYFGIAAGKIIRDKFIPDHALAMCLVVTENVPKLELDHTNAILFLKKKDFNIYVEKKGWNLVTYNGRALGWINALQNRINNNYPKSLRILKD